MLKLLKPLLRSRLTFVKLVREIIHFHPTQLCRLWQREPEMEHRLDWECLLHGGTAPGFQMVGMINTRGQKPALLAVEAE